MVSQGLTLGRHAADLGSVACFSVEDHVPMLIRGFRSVLTSVAVAGAALAAACTTPPPPPPPLPPLAIPPGIALSTTVIQDAAVFRSFLATSSAVSPNFQSPTDVSTALGLTSADSADQLLRGEIAYAAVIALQDPVFVASVRAYAGDPQARREMAARILNEPGYAVVFTGSDRAAGRAMATIQAQGHQLYLAGTAVRQAAYDVQKQPWSLAPVADRPGRLAHAKSAAQANTVAQLEQVAQLRAAAMGESPMPVSGDPAAAPFPPVIVRGLAVAALAALGEAGDDGLISLAPLLTDSPSATCLRTAKLNLYQCLAVARPNYEDIFCVGQHAMADTGQCVMIAAGAPAPAFSPPPENLSPIPPAPKPAAASKGAKKRKHH
jgi:hypothetical protein